MFSENNVGVLLVYVCSGPFASPGYCEERISKE
jgi:hypothetical protein